jgi:hypothetical protein
MAQANARGQSEMKKVLPAPVNAALNPASLLAHSDTVCLLTPTF